MNKITKVGCSALCSSLAGIVAANAGDLTISGGVDMTWMSKSAQTTGNPIGMGSNLTFKGSGELDNGWTVDLSIAHNNDATFSAAVVDLGMGGLGTLTFNHGDGNGLGAYDDKMPTAWEEAWGAGENPGIKLVAGVGSSTNVQYATPTIAGTTIKIAYAPQMGAADTYDKTSAANTDGKGKGLDAIININPSFGTEALSGLNIYAGGHYTHTHAKNITYQIDLYEAVGGVTFDIGPVSLGWGRSGHVTGLETGTTTVTAYRSDMYGVSFNVNDDLSISYGYHDSRKAGYANASAGSVSEANRKVEAESWQIAYTMGGASIRIAEVDTANSAFSAGTNRDTTVVSVGLAF